MAFDFSEFTQYAENLGEAKEAFEIWLKNWMIKQAMTMVGEAKKNTPVRTGLLRNSFFVGDGTFTLGRYKKGANAGKYYVKEQTAPTIASVLYENDEYTIFVANNVVYAAFVEYGHLTRNGWLYVKPVLMLTRAENEIKEKMPKRFKKDFRRWWKSIVDTQ